MIPTEEIDTTPGRRELAGSRPARKRLTALMLEIDASNSGVAIDLLLSYRAVEDWQGMIDLVEDMPEPLRWCGSSWPRPQPGRSWRGGRGSSGRRWTRTVERDAGQASGASTGIGGGGEGGPGVQGVGAAEQGIDAYRGGVEPMARPLLRRTLRREGAAGPGAPSRTRWSLPVERRLAGSSADIVEQLPASAASASQTARPLSPLALGEPWDETHCAGSGGVRSQQTYSMQAEAGRWRAACPGAPRPQRPSARWRSRWSARTSAIIASPTGTARMPTQGSWRPLVDDLDLVAERSIERRGVRIELVGLTAKRTTMSWPVEMPPRMPPALLDRKQRLAVVADADLVGVVLAGQRRGREAGADLDALDRIDAHHRLGEIGIELVVDRLAEPGGHARGDHLDHGAERGAAPCAPPSAAPPSAPPPRRPGTRTGCRSISFQSQLARSIAVGADLDQGALDGARPRPAPCARSRRPRPASRSRARSPGRRRDSRGCRTWPGR